MFPFCNSSFNGVHCPLFICYIKMKISKRSYVTRLYHVCLIHLSSPPSPPPNYPQYLIMIFFISSYTMQWELCALRWSLQLLGTLRSESSDGRENVAEKVNSPSFILHRDYSKSLSNFVKCRRTLLKLNS